MRGKQYTLRLRPGSSNRALAHDIEDYLTYEEGLRCIMMRTESGDYIIQGEDRHEEIIRWVGLGRSLSVRLTPVPQDLVHVDDIPEKKTGRYALIAAGVFLMRGMAVTSVCGVIRQNLLQRRFSWFIQERLS